MNAKRLAVAAVIVCGSAWVVASAFLYPGHLRHGRVVNAATLTGVNGLVAGVVLTGIRWFVGAGGEPKTGADRFEWRSIVERDSYRALELGCYLVGGLVLSVLQLRFG